MRDYLKLLRVKNYIKNFLILLPFCFSGLFQTFNENYLKLLYGFIAFSLVSSIVYIVNDIVDREQDRLHPTKKNRPIASGKISVTTAFIVISILTIIVVVLMGLLGNYLISIVLIAYCIVNLLYSFCIKNIPIADIIVLSSFFLFRVYFGALIVNVPVSVYLFLTVFSLAIMMGANKRKKEKQVSDSCRGSLEKYSYKYLDNLSQMFMLLTIVFYSLWIISGTNKLINLVVVQISIILVIAILLYYQYIVDRNEEGNPVDVVFKNPLMIILGVCYAILMFIGFIVKA